MYARGGKNTRSLFLFLLAGIVLGGFAGYYLGELPYFTWLNYGNDFGLTSPLVLELGILNLQFGLLIRFNVAGILGMVIGILIYKKI